MNISELLDSLKNNIDTMSMGEKILGGLYTALLAMLVVFTILLLISLIIKIINTQPKDKLLKTIHTENESLNIKNNDLREEIASNKSLNLEEHIECSDELISVITAAIVATSGKNIIVKRITRTNNNKSNWEKTTNT